MLILFPKYISAKADDVTSLKIVHSIPQISLICLNRRGSSQDQQLAKNMFEDLGFKVSSKVASHFKRQFFHIIGR